MPFLAYRGSGLVFFDDLSTGEFCPLRIPFDRLRAAVSPMDKPWGRGPNEVGDFAEPGGRGKVKTAPSHKALQKRHHDIPLNRAVRLSYLSAYEVPLLSKHCNQLNILLNYCNHGFRHPFAVPLMPRAGAPQKCINRSRSVLGPTEKRLLFLRGDRV
jgi:hypothetical protein